MLSWDTFLCFMIFVYESRGWVLLKILNLKTKLKNQLLCFSSLVIFFCFHHDSTFPQFFSLLMHYLLLNSLDFFTGEKLFYAIQKNMKSFFKIKLRWKIKFFQTLKTKQKICKYFFSYFDATDCAVCHFYVVEYYHNHTFTHQS